LILLCPICHSKITKGDISQIEVFKKKIHLIQNPVKIPVAGGKVITFNGRVNNPVVGNNNNISINTIKKTTKQKYPEGCIGYESLKANYISHLVQRYNEYKEYEVGKGNVNYATFASHLKKHYKIGATRTLYNLPTEKFDELVDYIQSRINNTKLGKIKGRGHKNFSTFEEYIKMQSNGN
jgi:hypothetical protein